jgi:hypothetical protein
MTEPYERTFVGRVVAITRSVESKDFASVTVETQETGYLQFQVLGSGSEWTPGQRVDVILRAVHEPKAEEVQDAD